MTKKRMGHLCIVIAVLMLMQLLPINWAEAILPSDLTGTDCVEVYGTTNAVYTERVSSLVIMDGATQILPDASGAYNNVPAGATIAQTYAFSLKDGDGATLYDYDGDEYFTMTLPAGLNFATVADQPLNVTDSTTGDNYVMALYTISGNTLTVNLTNAAEDTSGHGGAANDAHQDKWGKITVNGTFKSLASGGQDPTTIVFGSQVVTINREPLPTKSTLEKTCTYDAAANVISWLVTVTPPAGVATAYDGYTLTDVFSSGQNYVPGSFKIGAGASPASWTDVTEQSVGAVAGELDTSNLGANTISYTFSDTDPDTTGVQSFTYKTTPTDFSAERPGTETSTFRNTASLYNGPDAAADPKTATATFGWINKSGAKPAGESDITVAKWTVKVTVPVGGTGGITGALITDMINAAGTAEANKLALDATHPVEVRLGASAGLQTVTDSMTAAGQYAYDAATDILTYTFPTAGQPAAGDTYTLTFYTRAKNHDDYLDNNNQISFVNANAALSWNEYTGPAPSAGASVGNGVGSGGLLSKTAGTTTYAYADTDFGTIHWTVKINRNGINIVNATLNDTVPAGQKLLPGGVFKVTNATTGTVIYESGTPANAGVLDSTDLFLQNFSYVFPDEATGTVEATNTIKDVYTAEFDTQLVDTTAAHGDTSGLDTLYTNGDSNGRVAFTNRVTLTRTGATVGPVSGTKLYDTQMLDKSVATAYDYTTHLIQWKLTVNRNGLPLTNALVEDTLPDGMTLVMDATHPFGVIKNADASPTVTLADLSALPTEFVWDSLHNKFFYLLPAPADTASTDRYTVTFWTQVTDSTLQTQWTGVNYSKNFTNSASLDADEIGSPITDSHMVTLKNPVITKSVTNYHSGDKPDHLNWTVVINPGQVTLTDSLVTDVLNSGLRLDASSVKLYEVPVNAATGDVGAASAGTEIAAAATADATHYALTLPDPSGSNTFVVGLPTPTTQAYRLEFTTNIIANDLDIKNTATLSGVSGASGDADSTQIAISNLYSSGGSGSQQVTVHKEDDGHAPLSGAVFRLLNINKSPILSGGSYKEATTVGSGDAIFASLPSWVFYVEEMTPPNGYLLPVNQADRIFGAGVSGTQTITVANNRALGTVSFSKTGAGGIALTGGKFMLTGKDYKNEEVKMFAAAVNGTVSFSGVPLSKTGEAYTITETVSPDGHVLSADSLTATVAYNADKTGVTVNVTSGTLVNTPVLGTVSFSKTGAGGVPLAGGTFTLTGTNYSGGTVSMTTSAVSGIVTFTDVPIGSYTIAETNPPAGYLRPLTTDILTAKVEYNPTNTGVVTTVRDISAGTPIVNAYTNSMALGTVSFSKTSSSGASLNGGTFTLTGTDYAGGSVALTASSVAGTVTFTNVPLGSSYTIRETIPPAGYVRSNTELMASVAYNSDKTAVVTNVSPNTLSNMPAPDDTVYANVEINKTDEAGSKLAGATFALYNQSNSNLVATAVSDAQGVARFSSIPEGQYVIKENVAPTGYVLSTESISVKINSAATRTYTMINRAEKGTVGSIQIVKTDDAGNALAGAVFTLFNDSGTPLQSVVTGSDGRAVFDNVSVGAYMVSETRAPAGYEASADSRAVTVSSGEASSLTFTNKKTSTATATATCSVLIKKVDEEKKPLSGAEITLYDESGAAISRMVSAEDGLVLFDGLAPGKYIVRETIAPTGYELFTEPLTVDVLAGQTLLYTLRNRLLTDGEFNASGWTDDGIQNTPVPDGVLPKTGGIPLTFYLAMGGLSFLLAGVMLTRTKNHRKKNRM